MASHVNLQRFWEIEEIPGPGNSFCNSDVRKFVCKTPEEQFAEDFFVNTFSTLPDGRIVTGLPFFENAT